MSLVRVIAVEEDPIFHLVFNQRDVTGGMHKSDVRVIAVQEETNSHLEFCQRDVTDRTR